MTHRKKLYVAIQIALWGSAVGGALPLSAYADTLAPSSSSSANAAPITPPDVNSSQFSFDVQDANAATVGTFTWDNTNQ